MKIAVYGAGAIGALLGGELARTGAAEVTMIARGKTLENIRANGIRIQIDGEKRTGKPAATDNPAEAGQQDCVIVAVKANAAPAIAEKMVPLLGPETTVVTAQNGVPWWYFYGLEGPYENKRLETVDPGGVQWDTIGPERAIGCVVYPASEAVEPGVIKHISGDRFTLGEPSGKKTERVQAISKALTEAGFKAPVRPRIRDEIWVKLWGNLCFNPLSVLTGSTLEQLAGPGSVREVARSMMVEAQEIAEKLGVKFPIDVDKRIEGTRQVGAHRTSMLQDFDAGRSLEIDALVTVVKEMADLVGEPCPSIDIVLALVQEKARRAGLYDG